jgi:hypothetical protein
MKFPLGCICSTPGALGALETTGESPMHFIVRHSSGDWGVVCDGDKKLNDQALVDGDRILSAYELRDETRICIITESDRLVTTILLPDEY